MQEPMASTFGLNEVETIVRVVMQRLRSLDVAPELKETQPLSPALAASAPDTLRLSKRLITLEDLNGRMTAVKTLEVDARAIVTPAVRDELRSRAVALQRVAIEQVGDPAKRRAELLVIAQSNKQPMLVKPLQSLGARLFIAAGNNDVNLTALEEHFAERGSAGIWCSDRSYAAMRAATASSTVVAVQLSRMDDLPRALEQASPNTLILDDRDWPAAAIVNLARAWQRRLAG